MLRDCQLHGALGDQAALAGLACCICYSAPLVVIRLGCFSLPFPPKLAHCQHLPLASAILVKSKCVAAC